MSITNSAFLFMSNNFSFLFLFSPISRKVNSFGTIISVDEYNKNIVTKKPSHKKNVFFIENYSIFNSVFIIII